MALMRCDFFSEVLGLSTSMTVILPQQLMPSLGPLDRETRHPTLYLLHGLTDDHTTWTRRTSIERYVDGLGLAVVMPEVHRSFYTDERQGNRYWTFLTDELPKIVGGFFPISNRSEDTFVAGLSMGGYGAFKWALRHPERFAAAASLSGSLGIADRKRIGDEKSELLNRIFGTDLVSGTPDDVRWLLEQFDSTRAPMPQLYLCCGTEDSLIAENDRFSEVARNVGAPLTVDIGPGQHEWDYWDARIQDVLKWLPLHRGRLRSRFGPDAARG